MDVITFSQQTKQEADKLLQYGNVLAVLSQFGTVVLSGSYQYNLMYDPDIDLTVLSNNPEESSYQALLEFIKQRKFQKYEFGDFSTFPHQNRPKEIILVLVHEYNGRRWEIEIWFKKRLSEIDINFEKLISKVTKAQKAKILELKHQRSTQNISKQTLSSARIYKQVLLGKETELPDL